MYDSSLWKERDGARSTTATTTGLNYHTEEGTSSSGHFEPNDNCHLVPSPDAMAKRMHENVERPKHYIFAIGSMQLLSSYQFRPATSSLD
ncbi:hypothetical protein N7471_006141 [Penicillium samsonianum]|uniref:uncharacterized protein n=1 Tax=Penicillium samsonianum TaxID=1882272 RepID=UPI0025465FB1|nr:uncharacterized protein N7471_006141 [Penicillium samsonianum]KAJ6139655.1 hypothetical protein N7471_006141 [Penicillium samsonianum]